MKVADMTWSEFLALLAARGYQYDVAINLQDLTVRELEELMPALGVPNLRAGRRTTIRRPCPA